MRKLILEEFVSADGLAADADGTTAFFENAMPPDGEETRDQLASLSGRVDTILLGAETYRLFRTYWPTADSAKEGMADWINETAKVVVSTMLDDAPWGNYDPARVLSGDAAETVAALKREAGGDIIVWGSLTLTQVLLAAGLVDEVRLNVIPVLVGAGRRAFEHDGDPVPMRHLDATTYQPSGVSPDGSGFRGFTLAHNVGSRQAVDRLVAEATAGGAALGKVPEEKEWSGYLGYVADPDGVLRETAWSSGMDLT